GWTNNSDVGGAIAWDATDGGTLKLTSNETAAANADQNVSVSGADSGVEHALRIVVYRGPVILRVGTSVGDDTYITETSLDTGTHSLAFTPAGSFWIRFQSRAAYGVYVKQCTIEASGVMTLPTPWLEADLGTIRGDQSGDIVFCAAKSTYQQR